MNHLRDHVIVALAQQALRCEADPGVIGERHQPGAIRLALGGLPAGAKRKAAPRLVGAVAQMDPAHGHRAAARSCASNSPSRRRQTPAPSMQ